MNDKKNEVVKNTLIVFDKPCQLILNDIGENSILLGIHLYD